MQTRQMMNKGVETTAKTPEQEPILIDVIDGQHRLLAAQQLLPQLQAPVVHNVKRPRNYEEAVALLNPYHRLLAAQDPARLRFKLQKKPSTYTNPESSVETEIQDAGGRQTV